MRKRLACALGTLLVAGLAVGPGLEAAEAAPRRFQLAPGPVQVRFRAYGLGMVPIEGGFTRFGGTLTLDAADPGSCVLDLHADAASLQMPSAGMTEDALGPDLLDVTRYPEFRLVGQCRDGRLDAVLTLHGVSKPITADVTVSGGAWTASGIMRRAEWGMGARPLLAGPDVRVSVTAGLPQTPR